MPEEVSLDSFIKRIGEGNSKYCFFLGAGASRTSGIKTGNELVKQWDEDLRLENPSEHERWKKELNISKENMYNFYGEYYSRRFRDDPKEGYRFLQNLMSGQNIEPSIGYYILFQILEKTKNNVVITTNFDRLIQIASIRYGSKQLVEIGHESLASYIDLEADIPIVIKLHRDIFFNPMNAKEDIENLHKSWESGLNAVFSQYCPIFIGYGGNDPSVMKYLSKSENIEKFSSRQWRCPYWVAYGEETLNQNVLDFLQKSEGRLIKGNGFDNFMLRLEGALFPRYCLFEKDFFIKRAEHWYDILKKTRDKCTEEHVDAEVESISAGSSTLPKSTNTSKTDKKDIEQLRYQMLGLYTEKKYDDAVEVGKEVVKLDPKNALYRGLMGTIYHQMGRYQEAVEEKQKAVDLEPDNALYHQQLGVTLHEMGRYQEAVKEKQKAVDLEPDNALYHQQLGVTLYEMGRYQETVEEEQKAIALDPDNAEYHKSLGVTLHEMGRYQEAVEEKQKAVDLEPNNALYHQQLGVTLHEMGRYQEAVEEEQKAIALDPDNAEYHYSFSLTLRAMGRTEEADRERQRAHELAPDNPRYK